jgi:hypothetical protein
MHPLRSKMVEAALEVLPFDRQAAIRGVDLLAPIAPHQPSDDVRRSDGGGRATPCFRE